MGSFSLGGFKFTAFLNVRRGDPPEPNAIVRWTGFSIWVDSTGLLGRSKQSNIHTRYKIRYMQEKIEEVIVWKKAASQGRSIRAVVGSWGLEPQTSTVSR